MTSAQKFVPAGADLDPGRLYTNAVAKFAVYAQIGVLRALYGKLSVIVAGPLSR